MDRDANIARHLPRMARERPDQPALKVPRGRTADGRIDYLTLSFTELDAEVNAWVRRLQHKGVNPGDRTLVLVRQGLPLIAVVFALFKIGAVPVVIDPGMGLKPFLRCVRKTRPTALVAIPAGQLLSCVFLPSFSSVRSRIWVSGNTVARCGNGRTGPTSPTDDFCLPRLPTDLAAILFTSGSTGAPKGVCYQHGQFAAQVEMIRAQYGIEPGEVDLPMLPIFSLFNPALGMTTVVPEMDPSRPATADPAKLVQAVQQEKVTNSFGSPTLWGMVVSHCIENSTTLPSLRRVLSAGAPVPRSLWENAPRVLTGGKLHSPYGATECLPVSSVEGGTAAVGSFAGACVGSALEGVDIRIVEPVSGVMTADQLQRMLPAGRVGEIVVASPTVTQEYWDEPEATATAKVADGGGRLWHRMGDMGFLDADGRLWFCGRKAERVPTESGMLDTEPVERVFRIHPQVRRCALIGLGAGCPTFIPAVVVETVSPLEPGAWRALALELRALGKTQEHTSNIRHFLQHPAFPVDVRHNAKIHRLTLARWATNQTAVVVS
ncbi:MAG: fatty acid CoA ligase family protein [Opitutaceae bacterium]|nr:fatty acid CoA ligase family protein [Opitutaceae bacterium]